jgi:hypothetical protein
MVYIIGRDSIKAGLPDLGKFGEKTESLRYSEAKFGTPILMKTDVFSEETMKTGMAQENGFLKTQFACSPSKRHAEMRVA